MRHVSHCLVRSSVGHPYPLLSVSTELVWMAPRQSPRVRSSRLLRARRYRSAVQISFENISNDASNFTCGGLNRRKITAAELRQWLATVDLVVRAYLIDNLITNDPDVYYHCTPSWFGSRCQYLFSLQSFTARSRVWPRSQRSMCFVTHFYR